MKILIDIGHPAHVHLFKNFIWLMEKKGHEILVTARDKDVAIYLLKKYGINFLNRGKGYKGLFGKAFGMFKIDYKILQIAKKFQPDILIGGTGNIYIAEVASLLGRPSIIFDDTEHSFFETNLLKMFATIICTPSCYLKGLGKKQVRYNGYQELAYLHPNYFKPDSNVLKEAGLSKRDRFFILRFVSWEATHDIKQRGLDEQSKLKLVKLLEKYGKVFITSEKPLIEKFEKYKLKIPPEKIHDLLFFAMMYVGEGGTMATEAAILGTPSLLINPLAKHVGVHQELQNKYKLKYFFSNIKESWDKLNCLLEKTNLKKIWRKRREEMLKDKIDITEWMVHFIENYPESYYKIKSSQPTS